MSTKNIFSSTIRSFNRQGIAIVATLLVLVLSSCGSGRHSQRSAGDPNSISWIIIFKSSTPTDRINKTISDMKISIQNYIVKQDPSATVNFHTLPLNGLTIRLNANTTQGTRPRSPSGGPHFPPLKEYINLPYIQSVALDKVERSASQSKE